MGDRIDSQVSGPMEVIAEPIVALSGQDQPPVSVVEPESASTDQTVAQKPKKTGGEPKEKTIYKGVFRCGKKFKAQIQTNRVQHYLGLFDTEIEAARAYDNHARVVLGPRARTNFEYPQANAPGGQNVLVAPIFTKADSRAHNHGGEVAADQSAPPKRTYVGIKLKRQAISGMNAMMSDDKHTGVSNPGSTGIPPTCGMLPSAMAGLSGMPGFPNLGLPGFPPATARMQPSGGMAGAGMPGPMMNTEDQLRWYEQFFQLQQQMQAAGPSYYMPQASPAFPSTAGYGGFNPFLASMQFNAGGGSMMPSEGAPFVFMPDMTKFPGTASMDPYMSGMQLGGMNSLFSGMQGLFPSPFAVPAANGSSASALYPMQSQNQTQGGQARALDVSNMLRVSQQGARGGESSRDANLASLAATMSQAMQDSGRPVQGSTGANSALGHLLTLSEAAASSLPNSSDGSPEIARRHRQVSSGSQSSISSGNDGGSGRGSGGGNDRERTSQLLAAASAVLQEGGRRKRRRDGNATEVEAEAPDGAAGLDAEEGADEDEEPDWRDQLYYWTGVLYYDPARRQQVWKGSWVGSYGGRPQPEEFAASSNHFEYSMPVRNAKHVVRADGGFAPQSGRWEGHYLMDNHGSGALERYVDTVYEVKFEPERVTQSGVGIGAVGVGANKYQVYGRGDSAFGAFVVTGSFHQQSRVLEMTRQYVADTDVRAHMSLETFAQFCKQH